MRHSRFVSGISWTLESIRGCDQLFNDRSERLLLAGLSLRLRGLRQPQQEVPSTVASERSCAVSVGSSSAPSLRCLKPVIFRTASALLTLPDLVGLVPRRLVVQ